MHGIKRCWMALMVTLGVLALTSTVLAADAVTIRFQDWRLAEEPAGSSLRGIVEAFEREFPHIDVVLDPVSVNDKLTKFVTQSRGGDPPDVVRILTTDVPGFVEMGLLLPLNPLVAREGAEYLDDFSSFLVDAMTIDGNLYGLPHEGDALVIYYNVDRFREAGLDPDNPPSTWEEFIEACQKLTDPARGQWAFGMLAHPSLASIWMQSWFLANGTDFFNAHYTDTLIDTPEAIEAFEFYISLYTRYGVVPPGPTDVDYAAQINLFAQQQVAMIISPFAAYGGVVAANPELAGKVRMMQVPGRVKSSSGRGTVFSIASGSRHPEEAWTLIEFLNRPENQLRFFREATMMPTRESALSAPEVTRDPEVLVMLEAMETAVSYPVYTRWNEVNRHIVDAIHSALLRTKTPERALRDAAVQIRRVMQ